MTKILKNILLSFSVATAIVFFTACEKHSHLIETVIIDEPISFRNEIQPIFDAKCISCHKGAIVPDLRSENSYKALSEGSYLTQPAESSKLYEYVFTKSSHASYTSQDDKNLIYSWLLQGAEDIDDTEDN